MLSLPELELRQEGKSFVVVFPVVTISEVLEEPNAYTSQEHSFNRYSETRIVRTFEGRALFAPNQESARRREAIFIECASYHAQATTVASLKLKRASQSEKNLLPSLPPSSFSMSLPQCIYIERRQEGGQKYLHIFLLFSHVLHT